MDTLRRRAHIMDLNIQRPSNFMQTYFRRTIAAALVALLASVPATAQEAQGNGTLGAPELRDFRLPGTRVVPARPVEPADPPDSEPASPPPTAEQTPAPTRTVPAPAPADGPAARTSAPAPVVAAPPPPAPDTAPEAAPDSALVFPSAADIYSPEDFETAPAPAPALPVEQPTDTEDEITLGGMIWPALAAGLVLLAGLFFFRRRQRSALAAEGPALARAAVPEAAEPPAPSPVRKPVAAATREEDEAVRPVLEVEFKPDRMVATDAQAAVHFALTVRNSGKGPARNIRIEARMFNASAQQKQEIAAFLATPARSEGAAGQTMQPGQAVAYRSSVVMPKESAREIRIDGRPLFIPTVAVKIVYQWGQDRSGRTHRIYLIGIENQKSPGKMGPFRLDQGPRIYRSVGGRQIELARAS